MRSKKHVILTVSICLIFILSILAMCACNKSAPELEPTKLEGWTIRFKGPYIATASGEVEFNLSDYVNKDNPMVVSYRGGGHFINIDCDVRYKGEVQKDIWINWAILPQFKAKGTSEWKSVLGYNIPIKDDGEYLFSHCVLAHKDKFSFGNGSVAIGGGLSFNLKIIVK